MSVKVITRVCVSAMAVMLLTSGMVFAGAGARNISSTSAQHYLLGAARWTESDAADTPLMNPTGAAFMEDGIHLHASTMVSRTEWIAKSQASGMEYTNSSLGIIPAFAETYKNNNWAVFLTVSFPGGQGGGEWDKYPGFDYAADLFTQALGTTVKAKDHEFKFAGGQMAMALGFAYEINPMFSIGYGIRKVDVISYVEGSCKLVLPSTGQTLMKIKLDQERNGTAYGHMFSVLINPTEKLKIGLRYDPEVFIDQYTEIGSGDTTGAVDNERSENNLPAAFFAGAGYQFTPKLKIDTGFAWYFQKGVNGPDEPATQGWEAAWELQAGLEYRFTPKWQLLAGINFAHTGIPNDAYTINNISYADAFTFTLGAVYTPIHNLDLIFGAGYSPYPWNPKTSGDYMGVYEREVGSVDLVYIGVEYSL